MFLCAGEMMHGQAGPKTFKDSGVVFAAERGWCGSDRSLYTVSHVKQTQDQVTGCG